MVLFGAVFIFWESYVAVRCALYFSWMVRWDAVRLSAEQLFPTVRLSMHCSWKNGVPEVSTVATPYKSLRFATSFQISKRSCIYRDHVALNPTGTSLVYQLCTNSAILSLIRRMNRDIWHGSHSSTIRCAAFFSTNQLNWHRKKRLFYGLPPYSTVRCGEFFFLTILRCGAFFCFLRCRAVRNFVCRILRCGAVLLRDKIVRCG